MNSDTRNRRDPRILIAFVSCLFMVPALVLSQNTANNKQPKPAPAAPAQARRTLPAAQPQTVRTPPQNSPAQPPGHGTTQFPKSQPRGQGPVARPNQFNQPGPPPRQPIGDVSSNRA